MLVPFETFLWDYLNLNILILSKYYDWLAFSSEIYLLHFDKRKSCLYLELRIQWVTFLALDFEILCPQLWQSC